MNAVGIDVSKGKSIVAALRPMGEVALLPQVRTPPQQCSLTADDGASLPLEWCMATGGVVHRAAMLRTTRGCPCVCAWIHPQSGWYRRCR